jgi:hypothetical protein
MAMCILGHHENIHGVAMRTAIGLKSALGARKAAMTASLAIALGVGVSALVTAGPAVAEDAPAAAAPPADTSASPISDREQRKQQRQQAKAAKNDEASAGAEAGEASKPQATTEAANGTVVYVKPELVCRSQRVTGTRMPSRVCATADQWEAIDAKGEQGARDMKRALGDASSQSRVTSGTVGGQ